MIPPKVDVDTLSVRKKAKYKRRRRQLTSARKKYQKESMLRLTLALNRKTDAELIARLEASGNKNGYMRRLMCEDIDKRKALGNIVSVYKESDGIQGDLVGECAITYLKAFMAQNALKSCVATDGKVTAIIYIQEL